MLTMDNEYKSIENQETSLYDILNISKDAKQTEIKKAFRKLALSIFPVRNQHMIKHIIFI